MTNAASPSMRTAIEAAAAWRAKLDGDAVEADWLAYEAWLSEAPEHRAAADAVDLGLAEATQFDDALRTEAPADNVVPLTRRIAARPAIWISAAMALAASAVFFIATREPAPQVLAYAAPANADRQVTLDDGSLVHLNRGASIEVRYGRYRRIELSRGEASFSVVHDAARPFVVAAGDALIRDVGTEFNVASNAGSVVVTVRSGEVALAATGAAETHVGAGHQARVANGAIAVATIRADDAFSWQAGRLVYHAAPLAAVIEDLNRYSDTPIVLEGTSANALEFTGVLMIDQPQTMLARLSGFLPIRSEQEDERIVVRSRS